MKKILFLILSIIFLVIFLSGCSTGYFTLPDDSEFLSLIKELDLPRKICDYMLDNFTYRLNILPPLTPYQLYLCEKGDCDDFANFAMFIADYHGYETFLIKICYRNYAINHYLAIYKENNLYNFSDNQYYYLVNYDNFFDIVRLNSQWMYYSFGYIWSKYIVYDYSMNIIEIVNNN